MFWNSCNHGCWLNFGMNSYWISHLVAIPTKWQKPRFLTVTISKVRRGMAGIWVACTRWGLLRFGVINFVFRLLIEVYSTTWSIVKFLCWNTIMLSNLKVSETNMIKKAYCITEMQPTNKKCTSRLRSDSNMKNHENDEVWQTAAPSSGQWT